MTSHFAVFALLLAFAAASPAEACSVAASGHRFIPDLEGFERAHDFPIALIVPAPNVEIVSFERATSEVNGSCEAYAVVNLRVSIPENSPFKVSEIGFMFRSEPEKPQSPFMAFPNFPIASKHLTGNSAMFTFFLEDKPANWKEPFSLSLDVLAVNQGLQMSQSTVVAITGR